MNVSWVSKAPRDRRPEHVVADVVRRIGRLQIIILAVDDQRVQRAPARQCGHDVAAGGGVVLPSSGCAVPTAVGTVEMRQHQFAEASW